MKKVKIMLMSLAIIAVVGGALAFKAKHNSSTFCTTLAVQVNGVFTCTDALGIPLTCPTSIELSTTDVPNSAQPVCTTDRPAGQACDNVQPACASTTVTIVAD
jgi:hypothetical protein